MSQAKSVLEAAAAAGCPHALGAQFNPFAGPMLEDPHGYFARLRQEEPVTFSPVMNAWVVSRHDDICEVLKDPVRFSSSPMFRMATELSAEARAIFATEGVPMGDHPIVGPSVLALDPPDHLRLRRVINRGFTPARVAAQAPHIRRICEELIDAFLPAGRAELVEQFTSLLPLRLILSLAGVPHEDLRRVQRWSEDWMALLFGNVPAEAQVPLARSVAEYQRYWLAVIEERRKAPREDLASDLIAAEPNGEALTVPELITALQGALVAAGYESTNGMLANTLGLMLGQPGLWQRLGREPALRPQVIEECIRHGGVTLSVFRLVTQETTLGGVTLPQGALVVLLNMSANHDAAHFPEPDRFNPEREKQNGLTFGRGAHFCPGAPLARLEIQIAVDTLLERLPELRLSPEHRPEYVQSLIFRALKSLRVEWPPASRPGASAAAR